MEVLLTQALQNGAQDLARQLKMTDPNSMFVTGTGRARGFILDGHGIFFDVDVPEMRQSVVWSTQMLELEQQRRGLGGVGQEMAARMLLALGTRAENELFFLRAEALQPTDAAVAARGLELLDGLDAELRVEEGDGFGADALKAQKIED